MKKLLITAVLIFSSFTFASTVKAASASLFLSPLSGTYTVGQTFAASVKINSAGEEINAAEGTLIFNPAELQVVSLSKSGSIFSLWTTEPTFSNSIGNIVFGGGSPTSFTGNSGTVLTINFQVKSVASAQVSFSSGSVLAADGKGTNILGTMNGGAYTVKSTIVTPPAEEEYVAPQVPAGAPAAPIITSNTHPKENKWYSNNDPDFAWQLPAGVTGVSLMLHQKPTANPGPNSDGLMDSKKYENVEDGIWYFHIKFRNEYGWGPITHRQVLIDTIPPTIFKVIVDKQGILTNPSPVLYFESTDIPSGIEYYEVIIDREEKILAQAEDAAIADIKKNPFQMPPLDPGSHIAEVKAFDKAENFSLTEAEIEITPIEPPKITEIPGRVGVGELLEIKGISPPEITVRIYLQRGTEKPILEKIQVDSEGNFIFTYDKELTEGSYQVWAQSEDERGALSYPTKNYNLEIGLSPVLKFGKIAFDYLTVIVTLIVLVVGATAIIFYIWYRISVWRKKVKKETEEVKKSVSVAFEALRDELKEQLERLDKKPGLNKKEKRVQKKLKEALNISEKFINKEIKDIEKELE